ncbi:alpha/beta hydrolase [Zunongwangia sp. H14]|uniref:alpha/beta hydrolase n=1 Tax=Zunongwangia sp. H14 TaxID=3240792 RepID=UPI00356AE0B5
MKKINYNFLAFAFVALLFSSCSKEDGNEKTSENFARLSFSTALNQMLDKQSTFKNHLDDVPDCINGEPAYVQVALQDSDGNWVAGEDGDEDNFIEIPVLYDEEEDAWFTDYSMELELPEGIYTLEYFGVLTEDYEVLWIAPRENDEYGPVSFQDYVDEPLPISINLGNGVKKYVNVEVICYDNRLVNQYGYLFFDIESTQVINFCVFGNYCAENGRHYPANFRLDVWTYSGDPDAPMGTPLFDENNPYINVVGTNNYGDVYAEPLCITLPNTAGEDLYYAEISLIDFNSGETEGEIIRSGVFSDEDVMELYSDAENTDYYHFQQGECLAGDTPALLQEGSGLGLEFEPEGPAPDWGPTITDPMLVVIEQLLSYNVPPLYTLTAEEARQQPSFATALMDVMEEHNIPAQNTNVDTTGVSIPVEGGQIHGRIYTPDSGRDSYPVIVYFHGGGWVIAGIDTYDASIRALANKADAIVVAVAYRQAPEYKFPTANNDAYEAYLWTLDNAESFNGDSDNVAVVGESAGGNLAAGVSLMARNNGVQLPVHQTLIYPIANDNFSTASYLEYQNAVPLNRPLMMWFFDKYLNSPSEGDNPLISLVEADLSGLPSTTVISAEIDPLQSEGRQLAQELQRAGVQTTYELFTGVTHEFFGMAAVVPQAEEAQNLVASELREAFNN